MTYTYDKQNQLVSARYSGSTTDTISYTYDTAGNILTEGHGGVITRDYTYAYNDASTSNDAWHDLLVAADGHAITYDGSGNPLTYYNGYKTFTSLTWEQGRQLASVTTGGKTTSYTYDADGIRKTKSVPINRHGLTCTYTFVKQNGKVVRQSWRTESIDFFYDESGSPFAMTYQSANDAPQTYYYVLNLQGDVVKLVDVSGAEVASYEYDAWGNVLSQSGSMASTNPLRYRGYYYDSETGFYYLQSRYYDPATRRFINADVYASTDSRDAVSCNMFAYCGNNPVIYDDENGESFGLALLIGIGICALIGGAESYASARSSGASRKEAAIQAIIGGLSSGLTAAVASISGITAPAAAGIAAGIGLVSSTTSEVVHYAYNKDKPGYEFDLRQSCVNVLVGTAGNAASGGMAAGLNAVTSGEGVQAFVGGVASTSYACVFFSVKQIVAVIS